MILAFNALIIIFDAFLTYLKLFELQLGPQLFVASFGFVFCSIALQVSLPDKDGKFLDRMELKENVKCCCFLSSLLYMKPRKI